MSKSIYYDKGGVYLSLGDGEPVAGDAIEVYGNPNIKRDVQVIDDRTYSPQGDARPSVVGRENGPWVLGTIRAREFVVPGADGARPNYDKALRICGYKATWADKSNVAAEDTGLRGDASKTVFVMLAQEFPFKAGTVITITDGTQTITIGADDNVTGDGSVQKLSRLLGYLKVTFNAAPAADAQIQLGYQSGYRVRYERSNSDAELEYGRCKVTRFHDDLSKEDVREGTGLRGNAPMTIGQSGNIEWTPTGSCVPLPAAENDAPYEPVYAEDGANLVWDESTQVILCTVTEDGADSVAYEGHIPSLSVDPGFEVVQPDGAISPGYTPAARLRPQSPQVTVRLYTQQVGHMDLEALQIARTQLHLRAATPGREDGANVLGQGIRGQIVALGDPQEGPDGREVMEVTLKPLTMGNAYNVTASATAPRHYYHVCTEA